MNLELADEQTEALDPTAIPDYRRRPVPPQSPYGGIEENFREASPGARARGTAAAATELRAADDGTISPTQMKRYRGPPMTLGGAAAAHPSTYVW
jgi:hypothetical protein